MNIARASVILCVSAYAFTAAVLPIAADPQLPKITNEAAWSRATPPTAKVGAVYLTLRNPGSVTDNLVDGQTPVANRVKIHERIEQRSSPTARRLNVR